jgi:hypothetical protein
MLIVLDRSAVFKLDKARNPARNQLLKGSPGRWLKRMNRS